MASLSISCPHCHFTKDVPEERVPAGPVKVTCPQCRQQFEYRKPTALPAGGKEPEAAAPSPAPPVFAREHQRPQGAPSASAEKGPSLKVTRRQELTGIGDILAEACEIYKRRALTLIGLLLLVFLPIALLAAALYLLHSLFPSLQMVAPLVIGVALAGLLAICIVSSWSATALVFAVADEELSLRQALRTGWPRVLSFIWLSTLVAFIVQGGLLLFLLPGVLFAVWFSFAQFFLVEDDERGMTALLKCKAYVEGRVMQVAVRLLLFGIIPGILSLVPVAGPLLWLLSSPLAMICLFLTYRDLREIKGDIPFPTSTGEKWKWVGAGLLGHLVPIVLLLVYAGTAAYGTFKVLTSILNQQRLHAVGASAEPMAPPELPKFVRMQPAEELKPVDATAAQYDAALAAGKVDFGSESGPNTTVGPAAFLLDHFWDDASPHFWLKVKLVPLPNLDVAGRNCARIAIGKVLNKENTDIYDRTSPFEEEIHQYLSFGKSSIPNPHYVALRDIRVKEGTKQGDIETVSGELILTLPVKIETATLDASALGKEMAIGGARVTLTKLGEKTAGFTVGGDHRCFLRVFGYDKGGKMLSDAGKSWNVEGEAAKEAYWFSADPHSVKIMVAKSVIERRFPFEVKK